MYAVVYVIKPTIYDYKYQVSYEIIPDIIQIDKVVQMYD